MNFLIGWFSSKKGNKKPRLNFYTQKFQLRDALWLTLIGLFCFALMGFLLYLAMHRAADTSVDSQIAKELVAKTFSPKRVLTYFEVSVPLFIFCAFLLSIGIVASHRIAGPIFAIKRHMNRVRTGEIKGPINLRRNDELQDVAAALNRMLEQFWSQEEETNTLIDKASNALQTGHINDCKEFLLLAKTQIALPKSNKTQNVAVLPVKTAIGKKSKAA